MTRRKRHTYTAEQKADDVRMMKEGTGIPQVAKDPDLTSTALRAWVRQASGDEGKGEEGAMTTDERVVLRQLRRENREPSGWRASVTSAERHGRELVINALRYTFENEQEGGGASHVEVVCLMLGWPRFAVRAGPGWWGVARSRVAVGTALAFKQGETPAQN